jgi:CBS domain-containing protein
MTSTVGGEPMTERFTALIALAELRAVDIMDADPIAVAEHESVSAAAELLLRAGCPFLPVVRGDRIVGVVDDHAVRDSRERAAADAVVAHTRPATTVPAHAPLAEVVTAVRRGASELTIVVDEEGRLLGVITTARLIALLDAALGGQPV